MWVTKRFISSIRLERLFFLVLAVTMETLIKSALPYGNPCRRWNVWYAFPCRIVTAIKLRTFTFVGRVSGSVTRQILGNVGFRSSTQPTFCLNYGGDAGAWEREKG